MRVLITGVAGFIGFHLAEHLSKKKKFSVLGIDSLNKYYSIKLKKKRLALLSQFPNFEFKKINIAKSKRLESEILKFAPDIIFHLAGQPGVLYSFKNPRSYIVNNTEATVRLINIAKRVQIKKFIFASSSSVYGDQKKYPITENAKPNPKNLYALTKFECEKKIAKILKGTSTAYLIFRFFTVYGPYGRPDMFIHKFLNKLKKNQKIELYNSGKNYRDFTYIEDVIKVLVKSITKKIDKTVLNICRSHPIKTENLVNKILKLYKKNKIQIKKIGYVNGEMLKTHGSNQKLKKTLKIKSFKSIDEGLRKTIINFKKNNF